MDLQVLIIMGLTMVAAGGIVHVFLYPHLSGEIKAEKRQAALRSPALKRDTSRQADAANRRKQITDSIKELGERGKRRKHSLQTRIAQSGLSWSRNKYFVVSFAPAAFFGGLVWFAGAHPAVVLAAMGVGGFGVPAWVLSFLRKRRLKKFVNEFPNAVDIIIRGVKAGLPLGDCLRIIAAESAEPVRGEFRQIVEAQAMGFSTGEAVERIVDRVPIPEASFFSIVINIQQKAGGNLAEALGNLSAVLRDRKKMKGKIKAMSSEAKASAYIIGSLPFIVSGMVYVTSPKYIELLWITETGHIVMAACALWMCIGIFVMKNMINFDI
ncbi:MAG: type II secretion system F family protein [Beijerinckiaceae bacterium]|nr:type II secretion system F family protein [Beijerinckiaceae bacterium]MCI0736591.1 type II secretion system F family protein [Beijerinckiaceae bacterium]